MNYCDAIQIAHCTFTGNSAITGGGMFLRKCGWIDATECVFSANLATETGNSSGSGAVGGEGDDSGPARFIDCVFCGNAAPNSHGGALYDSWDKWEVQFGNCLIVGNMAGAGGRGGGVYFRNHTSSLTNCTIAHNDPIGVSVEGTTAEVRNAVIWGNTPTEVTAGVDELALRFSNIDDPNYEGMNGNMRLDPRFAGGPTGTWSTAGVFLRGSGTTILTDGTVDWGDDAHAGRTVNPAPGQNLEFYIVSNTRTALHVRGDATPLAAAGAAYAIYDYHLEHDSPCIDTADPAADWDLEPDHPKGARNMGFYGNTLEATVGDRPPPHYVDAAVGGGAGNGASWDDAFSNLNSALAGAAPGDWLWVAAGVYAPDAERSNSFSLVSYVDIYGGFTPGMSAFEERDASVHLTVLNGDPAGNDTTGWGVRGDNAYHVVSAQGVHHVTFDGFIIRGGHADDPADFRDQGGGMWCNACDSMTLSRCVFTDNSAIRGGGLYLRKCGRMEVLDCVFSANRATETGPDWGSGAAGGEGDGSGPAYFRGCVFCGNAAPDSAGGALFSSLDLWEVHFANCLVVGNYAGRTGDDLGGGFYLRGLYSEVINCTFSGNRPNALCIRDCTPLARNCILWADILGEVEVLSGGLDAWYCNIGQAGYDGVNGSISEDPKFTGGPTGTWSGDPAYDPETGTTELTDGTATWRRNRHAGCTVNPHTAQELQFFILSNTPTTLRIWGDAASIAADGTLYRIHDYHLATNSPCVDTGDPDSQWQSEPDYPKGRINMGAYGNTPTATVTNPAPTGAVLLVL